MTGVLSTRLRRAWEKRSTASTDTDTTLRRLSQNHRQRVLSILKSSDASLIRGVPVRSLLACGGALLSSSEGTAEMFALSTELKQLDTFISHNWSVGRFRKFAVLALHFNFKAALFCWAIGMVTMLLIADSAAAVTGRGHAIAVFCLVVGFIFGAELKRLIGIRSSMVFLDKLCIHQTDEERKLTGIRSIGAFLRISSSMTVVFGEEYLERLWTVYELAVFLCIKPSRCLLVLPTWTPSVLASTWVGSLLPFAALYYFLTMLSSVGYDLLTYVVLTLTSIIPGLGIMFVFSRKHSRMARAISTFDVRRAKCTVESDRVLVEANIASCMVAFGFVEPSASSQQALDTFNELVREDLSRAVKAQFGRAGLPLSYGTLAFLPWLQLAPDAASISSAGGALCVLVAMIIGPFLLGFAHWVFTTCMENFSMLAAAILGSAVVFLVQLLLLGSLFLLRSATNLVVATAVLCSLLVVANLWLYWPARGYGEWVAKPKPAQPLGCSFPSPAPLLQRMVTFSSGAGGSRFTADPGFLSIINRTGSSWAGFDHSGHTSRAPRTRSQLSSALRTSSELPSGISISPSCQPSTVEDAISYGPSHISEPDETVVVSI